MSLAMTGICLPTFVLGPSMVLVFAIWLMLRQGFAVNPDTGEVYMEAYKYFHNLMDMPVVLVLFLAVTYPIFPAVSSLREGMTVGDRIHASMLPALTLTLVITAHMMRMTRAAIINLLASPYILKEWAMRLLGHLNITNPAKEVKT